MKNTLKRAGYGGDEEYDLLVWSPTGGNEHSAAAVSHIPGSDVVGIRSTYNSEGAISLAGKKNLRNLRDALVEICKMEGIE